MKAKRQLPPVYARKALLACLAAAVILGACTGFGVGTTPTATETPPANRLKIYNWDTYIDPVILVSFQEETGAEIQYDTYGSQEEMYQVVSTKERTYDLVVITDYLVSQMRVDGQLLPLDKTNIPNFSNLDEKFVANVYDPGGRFCIPYLWGTVGIGYNTDKVDRITSWADLFRDTYAGRVALTDDSRTQLGALMLYLGYSPNTTNPLELKAIEDYMSINTWKVAEFAPDNGQDLLVDGTVDIAVEYSGDILQLAEDHPNIQYAIPGEGTIVWIDLICIPEGAENKALAEKFLNYLLDPQIGAALANYTHYATPNREALAFVNEEDRNNPDLYPSEEMRRRLFYLADIGLEAAAEYDAIWDRVLAGR